MNDMALPHGKQCGDCRHYQRCEALFRCEPHLVECDWSPSRFDERVWNPTVPTRVRIRAGAMKGGYGTLISMGGDDATYCGVKLDTGGNPAGYSKYELEPA